MSKKEVLPVKGFSKLSKAAKLEWIIENHFDGDTEALELLKTYSHTNVEVQKLHDEFIENTLSNFYMPFGVAPNFKIDGKMYTIPMTIEESSVVAAAAKAASFWLDRGGFHSQVVSTTKVGHVHFVWRGKNVDILENIVAKAQEDFLENSASITQNMTARGGGILGIRLINRSDLEPNYYQLEAKFETCDSMGANFINSCLESFAGTLKTAIESEPHLKEEENYVQILMSILSNFTPECVVKAWVECPVSEINEGSMPNEEFADKFVKALKVAEIEPYRAVTHNKGIMNGVDSVVIATGNDFRAIEACAHAYASRHGQYTSLTHAEVKDGQFKFWIEMPLALGTVGGITSLHPMVKFAHEMLGSPKASDLMRIVATAGLAQNFSALRSLITSGIQKGHMKMHLLNILNQLEATPDEKEKLVEHFKNNVVSFSAAVKAFCDLRGIEQPRQQSKN
jgi:hydroxymethylglutaryl-CoA reductase